VGDLTAAEREALLWAARIGQTVLSATSEGEGHRFELLESAVGKLEVAGQPHDCISCGVSIANCDKRIARGWRACCTSCAVTDTHGDTPSGYAERQRASKAGKPASLEAPDA
jgi:hypothetical protein